MKWKIIAVWLLSLLLWINVVLGSTGDMQPAFIECVNDCIQQSTKECSLPLSLVLTGWTCEADCKYQCMHRVEQLNKQMNITVQQQYYGKWPFTRMLGMQEPASVLFSLLNLYAHWRGFKQLLRRNTHKSNNMYLSQIYMALSVVNMNAWMWSSVFHTRDMPWTEKADYFGAMLNLVFAVWTSVYRLSLNFKNTERTSQPQQSSAVVLALFYVAHVWYLTSIPRFDYTYNMAAGVVVGLLQSVLWIIALFMIRSKPPHALKGLLCIIAVLSAMLLEVMDFPPLFGTLDAHSLWHLATAVIAPFWYSFLLDDIKWIKSATIKMGYS